MANDLINVSVETVNHIFSGEELPEIRGHLSGGQAFGFQQSTIARNDPHAREMILSTGKFTNNLKPCHRIRMKSEDGGKTFNISEVQLNGEVINPSDREAVFKAVDKIMQYKSLCTNAKVVTLKSGYDQIKAKKMHEAIKMEGTIKSIFKLEPNVAVDPRIENQARADQRKENREEIKIKAQEINAKAKQAVKSQGERDIKKSIAMTRNMKM